MSDIWGYIELLAFWKSVEEVKGWTTSGNCGRHTFLRNSVLLCFRVTHPRFRRDCFVLGPEIKPWLVRRYKATIGTTAPWHNQVESQLWKSNSVVHLTSGRVSPNVESSYHMRCSPKSRWLLRACRPKRKVPLIRTSEVRVVLQLWTLRQVRNGARFIVPISWVFWEDMALPPPWSRHPRVEGYRSRIQEETSTEMPCSPNKSEWWWWQNLTTLNTTHFLGAMEWGNVVVIYRLEKRRLMSPVDHPL
jgi:hypothetical protein